MVHDFKRFPELTNNQMAFYYWDSPHKQITENFTGIVTRVIDGDTFRIKTDFRSFDFPVRMARIAAPETDESGGAASRRWLASQIQGKEVDILLAKKRVGKWGRILGEVVFQGFNIGELSIMAGYSIEFDRRKDGSLPDIDRLYA